MRQILNWLFIVRVLLVAGLAAFSGGSSALSNSLNSSICSDVSRSKPTFIAHAGWGVAGHKYLNSQQGWFLAYEKGIRLFEADLLKTSDGVLVGVHHWDEWKTLTGNQEIIGIPDYRLVKKSLLLGEFKTVDANFIRKFLLKHPDSKLVTDKVDDYEALLDQVGNTDRTIVEVFNEGQISEARSYGYWDVMPSFAHNVLAIEKYSSDFGVKYFALHSATFDNSFRGRVNIFEELNVCAFIYTSNDPTYIEKSYRDGAYGFYTDFSAPSHQCSQDKCDTY